MAISRKEVQDFIWKTARDMGVDPTLATRLAHQESRFNQDARSPVGAIGVFQLMPGTARDLKVDPYDWQDNVKGGLTYLKQQLTRFGGDQRLALAAYNAGPGNVRKFGGVPPFKETQNYVRTILGGAGPPDTLTAQAPRRDAPPTLVAQAPSREAGPAPTQTAQESAPEPAAQGTDWSEILFSDARPALAQDGERTGGTDWAHLLFA